MGKKIPWPPPGDEAAVKIGCTCPQKENNNGEGFSTGYGNDYWVKSDCPVHKSAIPAHRLGKNNG